MLRKAASGSGDGAIFHCEHLLQRPGDRDKEGADTADLRETLPDPVRETAADHPAQKTAD
jgi:hypothetical protein